MAVPAPSSLPLQLDYLVIIDLEATCDDPNDPHRPEIVEFPWLVFDLRTNSVLDHKQIFVTPRWNANPNPPPEAVRGLGTDVAFAQSLVEAVMQFDSYIYQSFVVTGKSFCLMTDGHWDLKHLLFVEAARKAIVLAPHFRTYINLRAEVARCYPNAPIPSDRKTIFSYLDISTEKRASGLDECIALAAVVSRLINDGHHFSTPEVISDYEWSTMPARIPAIATPVTSAVPVGGIIRLRGLPWSCTEQHIEEFLHGITIVPSGIHFVRNSNGKATGEAFVQLDSPESVNHALARDKQSMGRRYIEVFKSSPVDMSNHLGRADARRHMHTPSYNSSTSSKGQSNLVVSSSAKTHHVPGQFSATASPSSQRSTGSLVQDFVNPACSQIQSVVLTSSGNAAIQTPNSTSRTPRQLGGRGHKDNAPIIPSNHLSASGSSTGLSYVVKVTGLPKTAAADDLLPIFDGLELVGGGIHIVPAASGSEGTGEAFVELTSEAWAKKAVSRSGSVLPRDVGVSNNDSPYLVEIKKSSASQLRNAFASPIAPSSDSNSHASVSSPASGEAQRDRGRRNTTNGKGGQSTGETFYFIRIRVMDDSIETEQLRDLFDKCNISDGEIKFIRGPLGDSNGVEGDKGAGRERLARASFKTKEARDHALMASKRSTFLGGHQVQLEDGGSDSKYSKAGAGKANAGSADGTVSNPSRVVRMRGLPYTSSESDIVQFFSGYTIAPSGISRGKDRHGRASGEAWVTFLTAEDAREVVAKLDKAHMGNRYIELKF